MLAANHLFYKKNGKLLLDEFSYRFLPGKVYGIIGPNGAGKTTLLKLLTYIWKPDSGRVLWRDRDFSALNRKEISRIATLVPHNTPIPFAFTVEEFVRMGSYCLEKQNSENDIRSALKKVNALDFAHLNIPDLSQGERQRIYLARALLAKTPVILFDEPTSNLDIYYRELIWEMIPHLAAEENKTILIAHHDLLAAEKYCDELLLLKSGKCIQSGSALNVLNSPAFKEAFFP